MADKTEEEQKLLDLLKLKRSLEKAELKDTEQYVTTAKQIEVLQAKVKEHQKGILKHFNDTNKAALALKSSLREMGNSMKQIGQIWVATDFTNIGTTLLKQNVEIEKSLHRTLVNSGKFGPSLREAEKDVIKLRTQFGATYQEAAAVVKTLSEKQYIGNLKEAADSSFLFARATGMEKEEVAQLTVALQKEGKISGKATTAMYADLLKIQQSNGMTKEGMKATTDQIVKMSAQMRAFGKSEGQIRQMAAATGRLVSSFEKVGISAQEATQWINKMLDPEQIEDNIKSYAALGISMTDALTGNIDQGQLETGLKEFGEKVKAMGPIAGKAYAQAMGISYSMAIKATDAEKATEEALTPEESAAKSLETLTEATQSFHEKIGETFNKLEGTLQRLPNSILAALGVLGPQIGKAISGAFSSAFKKVENDAVSVSERIAKQFEKGSLQAKDVMKMSADELYSYLDGTTLEEEKKMTEALDKVFAKMSQKPKGIKWFEEQQKGLQSVIESHKKHILGLTDEQNRLNGNLITIQKMKESLKQRNNLTDEQRVRLARLEQKERDINEAIKKRTVEMNKVSGEMNRQIGIQSKLNSKIKAARPSATKAMLPQKPSIMRRMGKTVLSAKNAIGEGFGKAKSTIGGIGGTIGKGLGKVKIVAGGIGGAIGKVMKVLGPIGIVVGVIGTLLKKSQKFQDMIKKIQEKVVEPILKQVGAIFDQIDFDAIADVLCALLPPVLKIISWALKPIVFVLNLISAGIRKILEWLHVSVDTEQQISENTSDSSNPMTINAHEDGSVRTHNAFNGENSSNSSSTTLEKSTASKPKNSSDTKVNNSGGGLFGGLANTLIKATPFGALSTAIEQFGGIAKEFIDMKKEQNSNSPAKQQALADSIRMGVEGITLEIKDGNSSKMADVTNFFRNNG